MPNFFEELTGPIDTDDVETSGKQGGFSLSNLVRRELGNLKKDANLPVGVVEAWDENGKKVLVSTSNPNAKTGKVKQQLDEMIADALLPMGAEIELDEDGNPTVVFDEDEAGKVSFGKRIMMGVTAEMTPDAVKGSTSAIVGLFRDFNGHMDGPALTKEEYARKLEQQQIRQERMDKIGGAALNIGKTVGGFMLSKAMDAGTAGASWIGRKAVDIAYGVAMKRAAKKAKAEADRFSKIRGLVDPDIIDGEVEDVT